MLINRKSCVFFQTMAVVLGFLLWGFVLPSAASKLWWEKDIPAAEQLWWQREIQPPPEGQAVNPDYINTREELGQAWSQLQRVNKYNNQYYRWGQRRYPQQSSYYRIWWKVSNLNKELSKTPMYVQQAPAAAPQTAPGASQTP